MTSRIKLLELAVRGEDGRDWYTTTLNNIDRVCQQKGWDTNKFIAVLAVTSPQVTVLQNMTTTLRFMEWGTSPKGVPSVLTSFKRLEEANFLIAAIKGPKTSRFAKALQGDHDQVVLDVHMAYALKVPPTKVRNKGVQEEAEKRIGWVAKQLGWTPAQAQAAIWTAQRRSAGYASTTDDLWEAADIIGIDVDQ